MKHYYRTQFLFCPLSLAPELGHGGVGGLGGAQGVKNVFQNIVMWHIKLKGMLSRTEC